jgi:hypothetical protein
MTAVTNTPRASESVAQSVVRRNRTHLPTGFVSSRLGDLIVSHETDGEQVTDEELHAVREAIICLEDAE